MLVVEESMMKHEMFQKAEAHAVLMYLVRLFAESQKELLAAKQIWVLKGRTLHSEQPAGGGSSRN